MCYQVFKFVGKDEPSPVEIDILVGNNIRAACAKAIALAIERGLAVRFVFNETVVIATGTDNLDLLVSKYYSDREKAGNTL